MEKKDIDINDIETLKNVRTELGDVSELMNSIKVNGLLQPIGLSKTGDMYVVVFGNRRFSACKKLGWTVLPADKYVLLPENMSAKQFSVFNVVENIQRKDISPIELGKQCFELKEKGMNSSEIGVLFSLGKQSIENYIEIYRSVPENFRSGIGHGRAGKKSLDLPVTTASHIVQSRLSKKETGDLFEMAHKDELSSSQVDLVIRSVKRGKTIKEAKELLETHTMRNMCLVVSLEREKELMQEYNLKSTTYLYAGIIKGKYPADKKLIV